MLLKYGAFYRLSRSGTGPKPGDWLRLRNLSHGSLVNWSSTLVYEPPSTTGDSARSTVATSSG